MEGEFDIAPAFSNSIDGKTVTAPPLSQRSDFQKVFSRHRRHLAGSLAVAGCLGILQAESWPGNLKQLRKTIQHGGAGQWQGYQRDIQNVLQSFARDGITACPQCIGSPVGRNLHYDQADLKETGGNVSVVARRLGVSRNTVYKHVREA